MRSRILTELERKMLQNFMKEGSKPKDFYTLLWRIRGSIERLQGDMRLILAVLEHEAKKK